MAEQEKECLRCAMYLNGWRSHGPYFPGDDWEFVESHDIQVGTHADFILPVGVVRCKTCGRLAETHCVYGDGYYFTSTS